MGCISMTAAHPRGTPPGKGRSQPPHFHRRPGLLICLLTQGEPWWGPGSCGPSAQSSTSPREATPAVQEAHQEPRPPLPKTWDPNLS